MYIKLYTQLQWYLNYICDDVGLLLSTPLELFIIVLPLAITQALGCFYEPEKHFFSLAATLRADISCPITWRGSGYVQDFIPPRCVRSTH